MWSENQTNITMAEGDYGIQLPITVKGTEFTANDVLRLTFKKTINSPVILEKEYTPSQNVVNLEFTEEESAKFPVGGYVYSLDWYQDGNFLCNIIPLAQFKVVDKA